MARRIQAGKGSAPFDHVDDGTSATTPRRWTISWTGPGVLQQPRPRGRPDHQPDVRAVSFDPAKGGYDAAAVDAALDRLEDVFARRERER